MASEINTHVERLDASKFTRFYAIGDVHGNIKQLTALLKGSHLIDDNKNWIAERSLLIFTGDLIDGGKDSLGVWQLVMKIKNEAIAKGSQVVVVRGNHEAKHAVDYLAKARQAHEKAKEHNDKADKFEKDKKPKKAKAQRDKAKEQQGKAEKNQDKAKEMAEPFKPHWEEIQKQMQALPPCVALGSFLFAHSGYLNLDEGKKSLQQYWDELDQAYRDGDQGAMADSDLVGSITCTHKWVPMDKKKKDFTLYIENMKSIKASGFTTLVAGHECKLFGKEFDTANAMITTSDFSFLKIDVGMKQGAIDDYPKDMKDDKKELMEKGNWGTILSCDISVASNPSRLIDPDYTQTFSTNPRCPNARAGNKVMAIEWPPADNGKPSAFVSAPDVEYAVTANDEEDVDENDPSEDYHEDGETEDQDIDGPIDDE